MSESLVPPYWPLGPSPRPLRLPAGTDILSISTPDILRDPAAAVQSALDGPIGGRAFDDLIAGKMSRNPRCRAVVVISDSTRPVPYKGDSGILWPIIERMRKAGIGASDITVLVATGTHRAMAESELRQMLDNRVFAEGIRVVNHDCRSKQDLVFLGTTTRGSEIHINRLYMESDIRVLTGLVESHFMAGVSGGRKSICPGLVGEKSTYVFHGAAMMADPMSRNLVLEGNPCHDDALEVARKAGADFIVNVTVDNSFRLTGVFAGDLEDAHLAAARMLASYTAIPFRKDYDIVAIHAGFVGINHYQAAKAGTIAASIVKPGGRVLMGADTTETDPVGSLSYRTVLGLQKLIGAERLEALLMSADWTFIPDQWEVQMWGKLFRKTPMNRFWFHSRQFTDADYRLVPGRPMAELAPAADRGDPAAVMEGALATAVVEAERELHRQPSVAWLQDGPYGVPVRRDG